MSRDSKQLNSKNSLNYFNNSPIDHNRSIVTFDDESSNLNLNNETSPKVNSNNITKRKLRLDKADTFNQETLDSGLSYKFRTDNLENLGLVDLNKTRIPKKIKKVSKDNTGGKLSGIIKGKKQKQVLFNISRGIKENEDESPINTPTNKTFLQPKWINASGRYFK